MTAMFWNPIVTKEVRSRMRTWRAPLVLMGFLIILATVGYAAYQTAAPLSAGTSNRGQVGTAVFGSLSATVMVLVALIVPGLVGGAISGERERQTLDLLMVTPVGPWRIVLGKLLSSLLFVVLLVVAALPLFSVVFILGGVDLGAVVAVVMVTLVTALALGGLAMLCSVLMRRTTSATVSSYIAAFVLFVLPLLAGALVYSASSSSVHTVQVGGGSIGISSQGSGGVITQISPPVIGGPPVQSRPAGPPTVILASPATAMFGAVANGFTTRSVCAYSSVRSAVQVTPLCRSSGAVAAADTVPDGVFGGWKYWEASSLIDGILALLAIGGSVLVLRGRRLRRRRVVLEG